MCNDKGVGKFTSKDASVVDYVIGSISFLTLVQHFSVLDSSNYFRTFILHYPSKVHVQKNQMTSLKKMKHRMLSSFNISIPSLSISNIPENSS
jgi:hypothetical protein